MQERMAPMAWKESVARERIRRHIDDAPETRVVVEDFDGYLDRRRAAVEAARREGRVERAWSIPNGQAVTTHGVHVYADLMDFNDVLTEVGRETPASHERAMQFLHLHYGACDALIEAFDIQRVDFHGSRLHAVVLTPTGAHNERARVDKAVAFSAALTTMVARAGDRYGGEFRTRVRIGIDTGPAIALNSGRSGEPEPLFVGSPANEAAHLAVGDEAGVYLSPRAERARTGALLIPVGASRATDHLISEALGRSFVFDGRDETAGRRIDDAFGRFVSRQAVLGESVVEGRVRPARFTFQRHNPPLRTIDYANHPPSRAIRMALASLFADISGFTAYVDRSLAAGATRQAVSNLYVLRAEMADVLQRDFGGRKVRFVGDCLHGVLAEGDARETDERETVRKAVLAAGGIRSSFELCRSLLPGIAGLGIAIGLELGQTPISRIGLSGDSSVRCSASRATCLSEAVQSDCGHDETAIGDAAFAAGDPRVRHLFGPAHVATGLDYDTALVQLGGVHSPVVIRSPDRFEAHGRF